MKARFGRKMKRALTFLMSVVLVAETINCAGMTVSAGTVSAGDVIAINEELKEDVTAAEKAAQAADEAAQAAQEALDAANELAKEAGDAALETAEDGSYTETVTEENGTTKEEPVLKKEINDAITDAEDKVDAANAETDKVQTEVENQLTEIVKPAEEETAEKLEDAQAAADAAEAAKEKAEEAAEKAQNAGDQFTAEKAAKEAAAAAKEAQKAADSAYEAYSEAADALAAAEKKYNEAVEDAELTVSDGDAQVAAQAAIDAAQKAIEEAEAIVKAAKEKYDAAVAANGTAQAAAEEAAEQAGIAEEAADQTVANLEEKKDVDVEALKAEKEVKEQELQAAIDAQPTINAEQDAIIAEAKTTKAAADAEIAKYDAAADVVNDLTDSSWKIYSELERAQIIIENGTGYCWKLAKKIKQSDIDNAKQIIAKYNAAIAVMDSIDVAAQKEIVATAESDIANAEATKNAAAQAISDKTAEIAGITASIETVTDYIYDNDEAVTYDMKDNDKYQKLLEELKASTANYNGSVALREKYEDVIDTDEDKLFTKIKKFFEEISMEYNLNGTEISFDWKNGVIYTNDGLTLMIGKDQQNVQTLLKWENDKLTVVTIDEAEFATYSATFDAVAASQAANKAAEAAAAEKAAQDKYKAALKALEAAQARLDAAKLNKLNIETAEAALKKAQENVDATKAEWEKAQKAADDAKKAAEDAKTEAETKPVKASFYVLNRGLAQPAEIYSYPAANYSKGVKGELYSGVLDEATGKRDDSYIALYKKGIKNSDEIAQYLAVQPTAEQLAERGIVLKEGESIRWYVIKTEGDGYHVDGIITGQKFDITVRYGRYDENGEFVDLAESKTETVGLGETYHIDSREIEDYVAGAAYVEGVATKDETLYVEYTAEETRTVRINYYRGSVAGTLLGTQDLEVAVSKVDAYASTIKTKWLNLKKPGDCNDGEMVSYVVTEDSAVANVVYAPIPVTPVTPPEPTTPEEVPGEGGPVIADANAPVAPVNVIPAPVEEPAEEEPVVEEPAEIEEEDAPLAPAIEEQDNSDDAEVVNIEEEETPLAAGNCWIHWLILILTAVYTAYELVRAIARNKKIKELADNGETVRA